MTRVAEWRDSSNYPPAAIIPLVYHRLHFFLGLKNESALHTVRQQSSISLPNVRRRDGR